MSLPKTVIKYVPPPSPYPNPATVAAGTGLPPSPVQNATDYFLRGDDAWELISYASLTGVPNAFPPQTHGVNHLPGGSDPIPGLNTGNPSGSISWSQLTGVPLAFAPLPHGTSHVLIDPIPLASASAPGLLQALDGSITQFLRGDGTWSVPAGAIGAIPLDQAGTPTDNTNLNATTLTHGLMPKLSGSATQVFRGDGSWGSTTISSVAWTTLTGVPATFTPSAHAASHITGGTDIIPVATFNNTGAMPKLSSIATNVMTGTGQWVDWGSVSSTISNAILLSNTLTARGSAGTVPIIANTGELVLATTQYSGAVPYLVTGGSGSGKQTQVWLRGDDTWETIPNVNAGAPGLAPTAPNDVNQVLNGSGSWAYPISGRFYGRDTTNNAAYAVTVTSDFALVTGVVVWVTPTITNAAASPTLNVNGTGAKTICTRTGLAIQGPYELAAGLTFGVVYDGTVWRLTTPVIRSYELELTASTNPVVNCSGYDGASAYIIIGSGGATTYTCGLVLSACRFSGFVFDVQMINNQSNATAYSFSLTDEAGVTMGQRFGSSSGTTGATAGYGFTSALTLDAGYFMSFHGHTTYGSVLGTI